MFLTEQQYVMRKLESYVANDLEWAKPSFTCMGAMVTREWYEIMEIHNRKLEAKVSNRVQTKQRAGK